MAKIIIVGGVAGGATAAARLRRLSEKDEIIILERDEFISFANCGLPYYIGGVIEERSHLLVQTVEGMSQRFHLDIRNFSEGVAINPQNKTITIYDKKGERTYAESYDTLILSPGAKPILPAFPGLEEAEGIFPLRNIPDTDKIKSYLQDHKPRRAVVVGGGFIGIEMAENLVEQGVEVTLVEKLPQVLRPLDFELAQLVHEELNAHGVDLRLGEGVAEFRQHGREVVLESGIRLETDMVILAIGVTPENALAKSAGLALGTRGHIVTNDTLQVFDQQTGEVIPDIYAVGDVIQVTDRIDGSPTAIPLAWPANRQGRLVADHIHGHQVSYPGSLGSSVVKVFSLTIAATGNNSATLSAKKIPHQAISAHRANHATYYPGASNIALKLLYSPESGQILGAQAVGKEGTEKRIDVLATVMSLKGSVYDLSALELCYAPPYSSAKDPVNILGYIAENVRDGLFTPIGVDKIENIIAQDGLVLDVRTALEFSVGQIKGSINIPLDELRQRVGEIAVSKDTPIYVLCQVGLRAHNACMILHNLGFTQLFNVAGGYLSYKAFRYLPKQIQTGSRSPSMDVDQQTLTPSDKTTDSGAGAMIKINACGLQCPGPLMALYQGITSAKIGDMIQIKVTDSGFIKDVKAWCETNGHQLVSIESDKNIHTATVRKGQKDSCLNLSPSQENATIVVFSGELDKALATMIIAQGAAAAGKKVTLFFTFWGLNILRRQEKVAVKKNFLEKMFGAMMPRGAKKLPLSSMNMLGMGSKMIKHIMKTHQVDDIETQIRKAQEVGVTFIACTMSMDLMGIKKEELIDGIEYAGVGSYIASNENAGTTLFI